MFSVFEFQLKLPKARGKMASIMTVVHCYSKHCIISSKGLSNVESVNVQQINLFSLFAFYSGVCCHVALCGWANGLCNHVQGVNVHWKAGK